MILIFDHQTIFSLKYFKLKSHTKNLTKFMIELSYFKLIQFRLVETNDLMKPMTMKRMTTKLMTTNQKLMDLKVWILILGYNFLYQHFFSLDFILLFFILDILWLRKVIWLYDRRKMIDMLKQFFLEINSFIPSGYSLTHWLRFSSTHNSQSVSSLKNVHIKT